MFWQEDIPFASLVAELEIRENAIEQLQQHVAAWIAGEDEAVQRICAAIVTCEQVSLTRDELAPVLAPLRERMWRDDDTAATHLDTLRRLPRNSFDLVTSNCLLDALEDEQAKLFLQYGYRALVSGGTFFFRCLIAGDPHRPLLAYFCDRALVERSLDKIYDCCGKAGIGRRNVAVRQEERALLIEVQKLE